MSMSIPHLLLVLLVVLLLFGGNRLSNVMGEFGKGLRSMKDALRKDEDENNGSSGPKA